MLYLLRYTLSTPDTFLPGIHGLSDVRRLTLKESCRDFLLSQSSSTPREDTEHQIADIIQKAVVASPTLLKEDLDEAERKISGGHWNELFLEGSDDGTVMLVEEEGKMVDASTMAGLDELIRTLHEVLSDSQSVWKLPSVDRGDFISEALFHDPDDEDVEFKNNDESMDDYVVRVRRVYLIQFAVAVNNILHGVEFDEERKGKITAALSSKEYFLLLLPDLFNCEAPMNMGRSTAKANIDTSLGESFCFFAKSGHDSDLSDITSGENLEYLPRTRKPRVSNEDGLNGSINITDVFDLEDDTKPSAVSDSCQLAEFANVSRQMARETLDNVGGDTEAATMALFNLISSQSSSIDMSEMSSVIDFDGESKSGLPTDSMNLAEATGTSRDHARSVIDYVDGDLERAADVILFLMLENAGQSPRPSQRSRKSIVSIPEGDEVKGDNSPTSTPQRSLKGRSVSFKLSPVQDSKESPEEPRPSKGIVEQTRQLNELCDPLRTESMHVLVKARSVKNVKGIENEECLCCPICFTTLVDSKNDKHPYDTSPFGSDAPMDVLKARTLKCGHSFCSPCLKKWVGKKGIPFHCPICREKIGYMSYKLKPWLKKKK